MPDIPASSLFGYLGAFALLVGFFLMLSGLGVIKVDKVTVASGPKTVIVALFILLAGSFLVWIDLGAPQLAPRPTPTPLVSSPTPSPTNASLPQIAQTQIITPSVMLTATVPVSSRVSMPFSLSELVAVPAGEFTMGAVSDHFDTAPAEKPLHQVYLDDYQIQRTEVTNAMFAAFIAATNYQTDAERKGYGNAWQDGVWRRVTGADWRHPQGPGTSVSGLDQHPVVQVSWIDAQAYCEWAGMRLPTEAELEKAARGSTPGGDDAWVFPWGNRFPWSDIDAAGRLLNFADKNLNVPWGSKDIDDGYQFTSPVGNYPDGVSPFGALDMVGNVAEWVADWYSESYYATAAYTAAPWQSPQGPSSGELKVVRGGSWHSNIADSRTMIRRGQEVDFSSDFYGFRCAK